MANEMLVASLSGHKGYVCSVAFSPNGQLLASASSDGNIIIWDVVTQTRKLTITEWPFYGIAFSPDGSLLVSACLTRENSVEDTISLWDVESGRKVDGYGNGAVAKAVAFSPDGELVAFSTGGNSDSYKRAGFLNAKEFDRDPKLFFNKTGTTDIVRSMAFSPNSQFLAIGTELRVVQLIEVATGEVKASGDVHRSRVHGITFSPDGSLLVSSGEDKTVVVWEPLTLAVKKKFSPHKKSVTSVAFSPDGKLLATGSEDYTAKLWDANTLTLKATYDHLEFVNSVAFSPDGKLLATGCDDKTAKLWRVNV